MLFILIELIFWFRVFIRFLRLVMFGVRIRVRCFFILFKVLWLLKLKLIF